ncbi:hypothetical protein DSO57_1019376 [Entomophthora muscae]|uniref:Uncharacterized protein n=1 Tax=Entomophthora muscae TaxID=34485 RepID=A0ACC2SSW0_9FUNG|nr:hypothetical protein DSO57_1019376 [Entomophthora muscae]
MQFIYLLTVLSSCQVFAGAEVQQLVASKEAITVKASYAGCCGRPSSSCESCHVDVATKLLVGNYHYQGNAILSYHLGQFKNTSTCTLEIPKQGVRVVGSSILNLQRSLSPDFDATSISWNRSPKLGGLMASIDLSIDNTIEMSHYCREAASQRLPLTFYLTAGFGSTSMELPSSKSNNPILLHIQN